MDEAVAQERRTLLGYLTAQRECVLDVVAGLDDAAARRAVVPSGWTPVGMVAHLCDAERYWFQWVLTGRMHGEALWPEGPDADRSGPFRTDLALSRVEAYYREQARISDDLLGRVEPGDAPAGTPLPFHAETARSVRSMVLHVVEETARHAGHLDVARELADGVVGRGPR